MPEPLRVAVIGVGRMGGPIAGHLLAAGHQVRMFDVAEASMAALVDRGAVAGSSPADAARGAAFVSVVVFDDDQARSVITGPEGLLGVLAEGAVIAVHTTVAIATIQELAAAAAAQGIVVLDAGISGGEEGARAGTLLTMVGGPAAAVEQVRPLLLSFSKDVIHAGDLGAGMALKLARNATGYTMMAAVHEAMGLATAAGVDLALLRRTIDETGVFDQALAPFALGGPEPLGADAPEGFRTMLSHVRDLGEKDLDQALDLAHHLDLDLPVAERARATFGRVMRLEA